MSSVCHIGPEPDSDRVHLSTAFTSSYLVLLCSFDISPSQTMSAKGSVKAEKVTLARDCSEQLRVLSLLTVSKLTRSFMYLQQSSSTVFTHSCAPGTNFDMRRLQLRIAGYPRYLELTLSVVGSPWTCRALTVKSK